MSLYQAMESEPCVRENTGNLEILENTGNFVCSSCKFPDSKGKGYCDICCKISIFYPEVGKVCQVSFTYVIVTNDVNWHRENLRLDRENTGNLKIQFEWVPCIGIQHRGVPLGYSLV